ncbi:MAG: hypothetical protein ACREA9_16730, partial [Pyrinomonadaceae bacterium]
SLTGLQAVCVAIVQPEASFNFNPLMRPSRNSIDSEQQRVILGLLGCWTEEPILVNPGQTRAEVSGISQPQPALRAVTHLKVLPPPAAQNRGALPRADDVLALPAAPREESRLLRYRRHPWLLATATLGFLLLFGVPTLIAINNNVKKTSSRNAASQSNSVSTEQSSPTEGLVDRTGAQPRGGLESVSGAPATRREKYGDHRVDPAGASVTAQPDAVQKDSASNSTLSEDAAKAASTVAANAAPAKSVQPQSEGQAVKVVMRIENGRVTQATIGASRPGSEAVESLALRIARQRRYPPGVSRQETLLIKVDKPK